MDPLNFNHLYYFWIVAREGGITAACKLLDLAPPTISAQVKMLERSVGTPLFHRTARRLTLTESGQIVFRHADEMFAAARDLTETLRGRSPGRPMRLSVGVADALPKLVVYRLLEPALRLSEPVQVVCQDGKPDRLLAELALHALDVVLSDAPLGPELNVKAFNHLLGECGVTIFGTSTLAKSWPGRFPARLASAPFILPASNTTLRRELDRWFDAQGFTPRVRGEADDSALIKVFGQSGEGFFAAPSVIEREVCRQYGVRVIGRIDEIRSRFYAITVERRIKNPAVVAISEAARRTFSE